MGYGDLHKRFPDIYDEEDVAYPIWEREREMKMDAEHDTDAYGRREPALTDRRQGVNGMRAKLVEYSLLLGPTKADHEAIETFLDWVEATR